jgi:cell division protein FtsB
MQSLKTRITRRVGFVRCWRVFCSTRRHRQRYELGTCPRKRGFPLDAVLCEVCTKFCMVRSNKTRAELRWPDGLARLLGRGQVGWRKVATGAGAVLALAMGYHVIFGQNGLTAYQQKRQDAQSLDHQLHTLQRENEALKGHVGRLQSDPNAIEHQAREELHYTRPGEVIYTLPASPNSTTTPTTPAR